MASTITTTDVVTSYGAYYINAGQNASRLRKIINYGAQIDQLFTPIPSEDTVLRMASAAMSRVLQPFQKDFTPIGDLEFTPSPIQLYEMKMDVAFVPHELEATWLGFLTANNLDPATWPFVRWAIETHLIPKMNEDLEQNEAWSGVYAAPTPGTAGAAGTAMNGIAKKLADHITAGDITPYATGALSATLATFLGQVESFAESIDLRYRSLPINIVMSEANALKYKKAKRAAYNTSYAQESDLMTIANFPNMKVVGLTCMDSSSRIWATPKDNAIVSVKKGSNQNVVNVQPVDRQVKIFTDFWKGYGFWIPGLVWTNDQV